MERTHSLRTKVLRQLLQHCTSVKTGSDRPWVSKGKDGVLVLKPHDSASRRVQAGNEQT